MLRQEIELERHLEAIESRAIITSYWLTSLSADNAFLPLCATWVHVRYVYDERNSRLSPSLGEEGVSSLMEYSLVIAPTVNK